jgi:hypothetical protein
MNRIFLPLIFTVLINSRLSSNEVNDQMRLEPSLALEQNDPNPFYMDEETTIAYSALNTFTASLIIFNGRNEIVFERAHLENKKGCIKISSHTLQPSPYRYGLFVNGRMLFMHKLLVLQKPEVAISTED